MKRAVNGDLMVLLTKQNDFHIYIYSNGVWQNNEFSVATLKNQFIRDYFMGTGNTLWALVGDFQNQQVEKIASSGDVKITLLPIQEINKSGFLTYKNLIADTPQRLWLTGGYPYFIAAFTPKWDNAAAEVIMYTTENSNYQADAGSSLFYFPNGLILSGNKQIVSMNTNLETLPMPLPNWLAQQDTSSIRFWLMCKGSGLR